MPTSYREAIPEVHALVKKLRPQYPDLAEADVTIKVLFARGADVERDFPRAEWHWYPVISPEHGHAFLCRLAVERGQMVMAEARWFGPRDGVVRVRKDG